MDLKLVVLASLLSPLTAFATPLAVKDGKVTFLAKGNPGFLSVEGTGADVQGKLNREGKSITGDLRVQMDKFSVPIDLRNSHMRDTYLKVKEYPESTLKLTSFEVDAAGLAKEKPFKGTMKLRGVEKPVAGVASLDKDGKLTAEVVISLKEFGFEPIKYATVKILDDVK
ncbi:MAG: YceI family protein, partial [Proteobacteria bacterium]